VGVPKILRFPTFFGRAFGVRFQGSSPCRPLGISFALRPRQHGWIKLKQAREDDVIQRAELAPAPKIPVVDRSEICGVLVRLDVEGSKHLFIRLGADGHIQRLGSTDRDILGGIASPDLFQRLVQKVTPSLLRWMGQSWSDPASKGKVCLLVVGFQKTDGRETMVRWEYGSESHEPPPEVLEFVIAAVEATNPWISEQHRLEWHRRRRRPLEAGWRLVPLMPV